MMKFNLHSYCPRLHAFEVAEVYNSGIKETSLYQRPLEEIRELNPLLLSPAQGEACRAPCWQRHVHSTALLSGLHTDQAGELPCPDCLLMCLGCPLPPPLCLKIIMLLGHVQIGQRFQKLSWLCPYLLCVFCPTSRQTEHIQAQYNKEVGNLEEQVKLVMMDVRSWEQKAGALLWSLE